MGLRICKDLTSAQKSLFLPFLNKNLIKVEQRKGCALEKKSSNILAILILSHRGTQAYEEVLSLKRVSGEDDKKEGKGSEKEAKTL